MSLFDLIGFIANFTIREKIIVQELWRCRKDWKYVPTKQIPADQATRNCVNRNDSSSMISRNRLYCPEFLKLPELRFVKIIKKENSDRHTKKHKRYR